MTVFLKAIASLLIIGLSACAHVHRDDAVGLTDPRSSVEYSAEEVDVFDPTELVEELERVIEQADEAEKIIEHYGELDDVTGAEAEEMGVEVEDFGLAYEK